MGDDKCVRTTILSIIPKVLTNIPTDYTRHVPIHHTGPIHLQCSKFVLNFSVIEEK